MEEAVGKGAIALLEFGVMGVFCLLCIGAIVYLARQNQRNYEKLLAAKDEQIRDLQDTLKTHSENQDKNIEALSRNVTRLIDLYQNMQTGLSELPDRVVAKIKN